MQPPTSTPAPAFSALTASSPTRRVLPTPASPPGRPVPRPPPAGALEGRLQPSQLLGASDEGRAAHPLRHASDYAEARRGAGVAQTRRRRGGSRGRSSTSALRGGAPAAPARGGDLHDVAGGEGDVGLGRQRPAVEPVAPALAGLAAVAARGGVAAAVG